MTIVDVRGGHRLRQRLGSLGLNQGTVVEVVQSLGHGPVIVAVEETRLALGRGASHKILVEPAPARI
jgi:ferrous iron transport protein A